MSPMSPMSPVLRMGRRPRVAVALLVCTPLLTACGSGSPDASSYREQAAKAVQTAISEVASVELVVDLLLDDKLQRSAAVTQIHASGESLTGTASSFSQLNPPPAEDPLSDRLGDLLDDSASSIDGTRVALHRGDADQLAQQRRSLRSILDDLRALEGKLS
jgi:hypothetical protein